MRGKEGVIDCTRLVRGRPFAEWVTVYYQPGKVTEEQLLAWIKANRCPKASHVRAPGESGIMNPFVAKGDTVQVRLKVDNATTLESVDVPKGWKLVGHKAGDALPAGEQLLAVQSAGDAKEGQEKISVRLGDGTRFLGSVWIVRQIGKH